VAVRVNPGLGLGLALTLYMFVGVCAFICIYVGGWVSG